MVDDANRQDVRQPNDGKEANKKLTAESLSDEQLEMIAGAWDDLRNSNTPMADLCEAMSQSKLFDFTSKYNTNNLELRAIASSARETLEARHLAQRNARKQELRHILDAQIIHQIKYIRPFSGKHRFMLQQMVGRPKRR